MILPPRGLDRSQVAENCLQASLWVQTMSASAYHSGRWLIEGSLSSAALDGLAVEVETSLLDVALQMGSSPYRHLLVQSAEGDIAGVVTDSDLLGFLARADTDESGDWKTRGVESIMPVRLRSETESSDADRRQQKGASVSDGTSLSCVPIVVGDQLVAVQTHDDLLLSWSQLEPLVRSATTDELTTLSNRAVFQRRFTEEWSRSTRFGEPLGLLLIDLDNFKEINDSLGHLAGDAVLAEFGVCLRKTLRLYDVVARFGGDEFAALCCNCDPPGIVAPARRLLSIAREMPLPRRQDGLQVSVSIGAAVVTGGLDQLSVEAVIDAADECLYASKLAGRNCAHFVTMNGTDRSEVTHIGSEEGTDSATQDALFFSNVSPGKTGLVR